MTPSPPPPYQIVCLGVDIGQIHDYSAVVAARWEEVLLIPGDPLFGEEPIWETQYTVLGAQRLELGTSYPKVAERINTMAKRLYDRDSRGDYHVLIDITGVGRGVLDLVRASIIPQVHVTGVTLTGGNKADHSIIWRNEGTISKSHLVSRLQALLQAQRLVAPKTPEMAAMVEDLKAFEIKTRANGTDESGAFAVGTHDDLVTALGLATIVDIQRVRAGPHRDDLPSPPL